MLLGSLLASSLLTAGAAARVGAARPVKTTLYAHGIHPIGEADVAQWISGNSLPDDPYTGRPPGTLTPTKPDSPAPKSMSFAHPLAGEECAVLFPTFEGKLTGTIKGDVKLTAHFLGAPSASLIARIWTDTAIRSCLPQKKPAREVRFDIPAGNNEALITFRNLNLRSRSRVMIAVVGPNVLNFSGSVWRLLYDSTNAPTRIDFNCVPPVGKKSCT